MFKKPITPTALLGPKLTRSNWVHRTIYIQLLLNLNFALLTTQCGFDVEDSIPPSPPQWVLKSLPEDWPERGIDAHESGGINLEWRINGSDEVVSSCIYRAEYDALIDTLSDYILVKNLEVENLENFSFVDQNIVIGKKYYYKLCSIDIANNRSIFSDSIQYKSTPKVDRSTLSPNSTITALTKTRGLSWNSYYHMEMVNYIITVIKPPSRIVVRSLFHPASYIGRETWTIPDSVALDSGQVYLWRVDTGAEYINDVETAGSESSWASFLYIGF